MESYHTCPACHIHLRQCGQLHFIIISSGYRIFNSVMYHLFNQFVSNFWPQLHILVYTHDYFFRLNSKLSNYWVSGCACFQFWYMSAKLPSRKCILITRMELSWQWENAGAHQRGSPGSDMIFWFTALITRQVFTQMEYEQVLIFCKEMPLICICKEIPNSFLSKVSSYFPRV